MMHNDPYKSDWENTVESAREQENRRLSIEARYPPLPDKKESKMEAPEDALTADGFDEAIIGVAHIHSKKIVAYDTNKCIKILMKNMTHEEAMEYFDFNVAGSYVGEHTPAFIEV